MTDPWIIVSWVGVICLCIVSVAATAAIVVGLFSKPRKGKTTKIQ